MLSPIIQYVLYVNLHNMLTAYKAYTTHQRMDNVDISYVRRTAPITCFPISRAMSEIWLSLYSIEN